MFRHFFRAPDDGGAAGGFDLPAADPSEGAPGPAAQAAGPELPGAPAQAGASFYQYGEHQFSGPEELTRHLDRHTLLKKGHDAAARTLADDRRTWESERDSNKSTLEDAQRKAQQYDQLEAAINGNEQTRRWFRQQFSRQPTSGDIRAGAQSDIERAIAAERQKWDAENAPMREHFETQQQTAQRDDAISAAASQFGEGFPEDAVREDLQALADLPGDDEQAWVTLLAVTLARARGASPFDPGGGQGVPMPVPPGTRRMGQGPSRPATNAKPKFSTPSELAEAQKTALRSNGVGHLAIGV